MSLRKKPTLEDTPKERYGLVKLSRQVYTTSQFVCYCQTDAVLLFTLRY